MEPDDYISFGDMARRRCGMQCQYASRYLDTSIGEGLRFKGDSANYHTLRIHKEDADTFVARAREYRIHSMIGWSGEEDGA